MSKALLTKILAGAAIGTFSATSPLIRVVNSGGERLEGEASKLFNISDAEIEGAKGICWIKRKGDDWRTNLPEDLRSEWVGASGSKKDLKNILKPEGGGQQGNSSERTVWEREADFTVGFTFRHGKEKCKKGKEMPAAWFETKVKGIPYLFAIEWERPWNDSNKGFMEEPEWQKKESSKNISNGVKEFLKANGNGSLFGYFWKKISNDGAWVVTTKQ